MESSDKRPGRSWNNISSKLFKGVFLLIHSDKELLIVNPAGVLFHQYPGVHWSSNSRSKNDRFRTFILDIFGIRKIKFAGEGMGVFF